jgi:hypothetical protein
MDTSAQAIGNSDDGRRGPDVIAGVPDVGRVARDTSAQRIGLVLSVEGRRVRLRSLATGRVWEADPSVIRTVTAREELSMRLAAANARTQRRR